MTHNATIVGPGGTIVADQGADGVEPWDVNVGSNNVVDANNSTTTPLGAGATWSGTFTDVRAYAGTSIFLKADVDSASSGVRIIHSSDGVTDERVVSLFFDASELPQGIVYLIPASTEYVRLEYINGATPQTSFVVATKHADTPFQLPALPLSVGVSGNSVALLVSAGITLPDDLGDYARIHRTGTALDVAIDTQNVDLALASFDSGDTATATVGSGGATDLKALVTVPPGGLYQVLVKNDGSSNRNVRIGFTSGAVATDGGSFVLEPGQGIVLPMTDTLGLFGRTAAGTTPVSLLVMGDAS